jgi:hypothetical protein
MSAEAGALAGASNGSDGSPAIVARESARQRAREQQPVVALLDERQFQLSALPGKVRLLDHLSSRKQSSCQEVGPAGWSALLGRKFISLKVTESVS